jgi:hypothetical protein
MIQFEWPLQPSFLTVSAGQMNALMPLTAVEEQYDLSQFSTVRVPIEHCIFYTLQVYIKTVTDRGL